MKYLEFTGKLLSYNHLKNSINGNPAYHAIFINDNGETLEGRTAPDAACAYGFLNYEYEPRRVRYHFTPSGNVRFDYVDVLRG